VFACFVWSVQTSKGKRIKKEKAPVSSS
jgi:hypothetical protein